MLRRMMQKIVAFYDMDTSEAPPYFLIVLSTIGLSLGKNISAKVFTIAGTFITISFVIGAIIQIVRKDKNIRNFIAYCIGTIFMIFLIIFMRSLEYYSSTHNKVMIGNLAKIFVGTVSVLIDIIGISYIIDKGNPRGRKVLFIIGMVYFTAMTILAIIYL